MDANEQVERFSRFVRVEEELVEFKRALGEYYEACGIYPFGPHKDGHQPNHFPRLFEALMGKRPPEGAGGQVHQIPGAGAGRGVHQASRLVSVTRPGVRSAVHAEVTKLTGGDGR